MAPVSSHIQMSRSTKAAGNLAKMLMPPTLNLAINCKPSSTALTDEKTTKGIIMASPPLPSFQSAMVSTSTVTASVLCLLLSQAAATNAEGKQFLEEKAAEEGVISLPSGLLYKVLKKGEGQHHPTADAPCDCHYAGSLIDGTEFDSSYKRGKPTTFAPKQVIKGWTEAMQLMVEGDKWGQFDCNRLLHE